MPTRREEVLAALFARLRTVPGAAVKREEPLPDKVPASGLVILRDGYPGEPEMLLSPLAYLWQHQAKIETVVQQAPADAATAALDALLAEVGAALAADRTLGGLVDWIEWGAPRHQRGIPVSWRRCDRSVSRLAIKVGSVEVT